MQDRLYLNPCRVRLLVCLPNLLPPNQVSRDIAAFLEAVDKTPVSSRKPSGRLIFAMDATASRGPSWDMAMSIQADMFAEAEALGGLEVQLLYYRGLAECRASAWTSNAKELGRLDIGQTVVVKNRAPLALEAIEGTDALIRRCGELKRQAKGPVLIKRAKSGQEQRVDLPTVGPATVEGCAATGFAGIAIEAGRTLVVDRYATIAAADAAGLFLIGLDPGAD